MQKYDNNKAVRKYKQREYSSLRVEAKAQYIDEIKNFCQDMGVSYTSFVLRACSYFIKKGELPPEN